MHPCWEVEQDEVGAKVRNRVGDSINESGRRRDMTCKDGVVVVELREKRAGSACCQSEARGVEEASRNIPIPSDPSVGDPFEKAWPLQRHRRRSRDEG